MIDVSVIMPIYNAMRTLPQTMDTVLAQTWKNIEVICVDDGSTDGTGEWLDQLAEKTALVRVIHKENGGAASARNTGMKEATGRYITFWDSDDFFEPDLIEKAILRANKTDAQMVVYGIDRYEYDGDSYTVTTDRLSPMRYWQRPDGAVFSFQDIGGDTPYGSVHGYVQDKLFSTAWVRQRGILFPEFQRKSYFEDTEFTYSLMYGMERITVIDEILVHYAIHSQSVTARFIQHKEEFLNHIGSMPLRIHSTFSDLGMSEKDLKKWDSYSIRFWMHELQSCTGRQTAQVMFSLLRDDWLPKLGVFEWEDKDYLRVADRLFIRLMQNCDLDTVMKMLPTVAEDGVEFVAMRIQMERRSASLQRVQQNLNVMIHENGVLQNEKAQLQIRLDGAEAQLNRIRSTIVYRAARKVTHGLRRIRRIIKRS